MSDERKEMESRKAENVREARCLSIDGRDVQGHPKELRFSNKYYHHGEERKGSEIINQKSIVPVTEYVLKVGFN